MNLDAAISLAKTAVSTRSLSDLYEAASAISLLYCKIDHDQHREIFDLYVFEDRITESDNIDPSGALKIKIYEDERDFVVQSLTSFMRKANSGAYTF